MTSLTLTSTTSSSSASTSETLWISASIIVNDDKEPEVARQALQTLIQHTQQEPGCIRFEIRPDLENTRKFLLWEEWVNPEALQEHFRMPHTQDYLSQELTRVEYIERLGSCI